MKTASIFATLLAAAAFLKHPLRDVATQAVKDAYAAVKAHLQKRFADKPGAAQALELATAKPESLLRKALLVEESAPYALDRDAELQALATRLATVLPVSAEVTQSVSVAGQGNRVQVAGRDLVTTVKRISRNTITPDARHVTAEQRVQLQAVIAEVAVRLAGDGGKPNFAGVHRMLQQRFDVASYLLLTREEFLAALSFLKQQRAIHRSRLKRRDPVAYRNDFFRAVFAGARELKWNGDQVYRFATSVLGLSRPVASLKELGPVQLETLATAMQREVAKQRKVVTP